MTDISDSCEINDKSRKSWSEQEDNVLVKLVKKYGTKRWMDISKAMVEMFDLTGKTGKQCRQRWVNHLDPKINKLQWTIEEERIIFDAHKNYGNKWKQIAKLLNNRTDNSIKNHFYSILRKGLRRINKMIGDRKSTEKIKQIRTSVLSRLFNIQNQIEAESNQSCINFNESNIYELLFQFSLMKSGNISQKNLTFDIKLKFNDMISHLKSLSCEEKHKKQINVAQNKQKKNRKCSGQIIDEENDNISDSQKDKNENNMSDEDFGINMNNEKMSSCLANKDIKQKQIPQYEKFFVNSEECKKPENQVNLDKNKIENVVEKQFSSEETDEKSQFNFALNITINIQDQSQPFNYSQSKDLFNFNSCFNTSPLFGFKNNFNQIMTRTPRINSPGAFNFCNPSSNVNFLSGFSTKDYQSGSENQFEKILQQLKNSIDTNSNGYNNGSNIRINSSRNSLVDSMNTFNLHFSTPKAY